MLHNQNFKKANNKIAIEIRLPPRDPTSLVSGFYTQARNERVSRKFIRDGRKIPNEQLQQVSKMIQRIIDNSWHENFDCKAFAMTLRSMTYYALTWDYIINRGWEKTLLDHIYDKAEYFNHKDIAAVLISLANFELSWRKLSESNIAEGLFQAVGTNIQSFDVQELCNVIWSFANLEVNKDDLKGSNLNELILEKIKQKTNQFNHVDIGQTLWALAHMRYTKQELEDNGLMPLLINTIMRNAEGLKLDMVSLTQIKMAQYWFDFTLPGEEGQMLQQEFDSNIAGASPKSSNTHVLLSKRIKAMVPNVEINDEYEVAPGLWADMACTYYDPKSQRERLVVIEIDGENFHSKYFNEFKDTLMLKNGVDEIFHWKVPYNVPINSISEPAIRQIAKQAGLLNKRRYAPIQYKPMKKNIDADGWETVGSVMSDSSEGVSEESQNMHTNQGIESGTKKSSSRRRKSRTKKSNNSVLTQPQNDASHGSHHQTTSEGGSSFASSSYESSQESSKEIDNINAEEANAQPVAPLQTTKHSTSLCCKLGLFASATATTVVVISSAYYMHQGMKP